MAKKSTTSIASIADGIRAISTALNEMAVAIKKLEASEKRRLALIEKLGQLSEQPARSATVLKVQASVAREGSIIQALTNILTSRHEAAMKIIGNVV